MPDSAGTIVDAVSVSELTHRYKHIVALEAVSLAFPRGSDTAIIGPDGVGKSSLLSLIAGARVIQTGRIEVLGGDMASEEARSTLAPRIAFMPQGLGKNLYPSLSVAENLDFFASLYATPAADLTIRRDQLLKATGLDPFPDRPAGKLSGGMRQKLSLCCSLVHDPELLILDEPTTGIDPLSRRQFWQLIDRIRAVNPNLTLIVATAYMEEASRFSRLVAMDSGKVLSAGSTSDVIARAGAKTVEEAYVALRHHGGEKPHTAPPVLERKVFDSVPAIVAEELTCRFGDFTAVDKVSFRIDRGEIFGFLGSNGCGKTTTMKMLTGLLPATSGRAELLGSKVDATDIETRRRVGYMSQSFSLYGELTVRANLVLHAKLYGLEGPVLNKKVIDALKRFELEPLADVYPAALPLGIRQRLQLAVACLHEPDVLILDEPTSGVAPETRDAFWGLLLDLSRRDGVTIFISTHFMNEAARCDRVSFMHAGRVLAVGTPDELLTATRSDDLEGAFVATLEAAMGGAASPSKEELAFGSAASRVRPGLRTWFNWVSAFAAREARELFRDRIRLGVAFGAPLALMMVFVRGISFDIEALPFSMLDRDQSAESQSLTQHLAGSRYFTERQPVLADADVDRRLQAAEAALIVEIPPGFGRELLRGHQPTISLWLDGANPSRARTARGYAEGVVQSFISTVSEDNRNVRPIAGLNLEPRFMYNQDFRSISAMTPGVIMFLIMMITAMMTALGVVREREIGSFINVSVSPATVGSFLVGKFLPYILVGSVTLVLMTIVAVIVLDVPVKGSYAALGLGGFFYVIAAAGFGILVSALMRSQVAAIFACAILTIVPALNFAGFLQPVSNLSPEARMIGLGFPSSWFQDISMGVFAKGLTLENFTGVISALAMFPFVYLVLASFLLKKQER